MRLIVVCLFVLLSGCTTMMKEQSSTPVIDQMSADTDVNVKEICGLTPRDPKTTEAQRNECMDKIDKVILSRLGDVYPYGSNDTIKRKCDAYPIECRDPRNWEIWVKESHNKNLESMNEQQRAQQQAITAQRLQNLGNALQNSNRQPTTKCSSSKNLFGGYDTECR